MFEFFDSKSESSKFLLLTSCTIMVITILTLHFKFILFTFSFFYILFLTLINFTLRHRPHRRRRRRCRHIASILFMACFGPLSLSSSLPKPLFIIIQQQIYKYNLNFSAAKKNTKKNLYKNKNKNNSINYLQL